MEYGLFDNNAKEFIINKYDTERPWINYISNGSYCSLISQTGGGYSFWREPKFNRITKHRYDNIPQDRPGKYLYFRDMESGEYWSNGWQPVMKEPEAWQARHGLGYSVITSTYNKISTSASYFVPGQEDMEVWIIKITNNDSKTRKIKVTPYVEFSLFNALDEYLSYPNLRFFCDAEYSKDLNAILYFMHHHSWMNLGKVFMGLSIPISNVTMDRRLFLGKYGSETNPEVIITGKEDSKPVYGSDCVGAPEVDLELKPGQSIEFTVMLGVDNNKPGRVKELMAKYSNVDTAKKEMQAVKSKWENLLGNFHINCPDQDINDMTNIWHQYQLKVTFDWSRWASYYHTGTSSGIGFRDTNQDSLGMLHIAPELVRDKILLLAKNMYEDGHSYHSFFPEGGVADDRKYGDDHIWINTSTYHYVCETGDLSILDEVVPFIEGSTGTLFEHLVRSIEYALTVTGHHGLPKMFFADWNDCLNNICLKEKGEKGVSVMVAQQAYQFGNYLLQLAKWSKKEDRVKELPAKLENLKKVLNDVTWDGEWYTRAYTDEGRVIGGKESGEGQIFLNTQSWAVFANVADKEKGEKCMDSVYTLLNSEYGIKLLHPPFTSFPMDIGSTIHYPAGIKENAGIFCHANTWAIIAETLLSRGERAMQYYKQILPPLVAKKIGYDRYRVEPYVYCQFITGPDHQNHGAASHSWLTGTAVWTFVALSQYILGVKPTLDGLIVNPCIPKDWPGFEVNRKFRDAQYEIKVKNPSKVNSGVKKITLNGKELSSNVIPVQPAGSKNLVEVELG